ncbi:MAG TPA: phospholipase D-like domain-containing protein [Chryseolinea sp.]|nr:phospholipase D-like domain-containing protein [Chryseolinea sp.]
MTISKNELIQKGGYTSNNGIELIRGGAPFFDLLERLIDGASQSIHFQMYIYEEDETGQRIAHALIRAANRGVKVYLLLDGYASRSFRDSATLTDIKNAGIHFRWFEPLFRGHNFFVGRRMHHKIIVADEAQGLVAGLNITNRYNDIDGQPGWLDYGALVRGEAAKELYNRCVQMWFRRAPRSNNVSVRTPPGPDGDCFVRVRVNDWARNRNQISRSYIEMLQRAQKSITIMSSYFVPGRVIRKYLRAASKRGVKIRIIMTKSSDIALAKAAERFFYPWLLRRNIEIYEYRQKVLHAKVATYDNLWVTIGSYNVNDLSAYASIELNLDVHDQGFSATVDQALDRIIERDCDRITADTYQRSTRIWNTAIYRMAYSLVRLFLFVFTINFGNEKSR